MPWKYFEETNSELMKSPDHESLLMLGAHSPTDGASSPLVRAALVYPFLKCTMHDLEGEGWCGDLLRMYCKLSSFAPNFSL